MHTSVVVWWDKEGWTITKHQLRGYDSPDTWYKVSAPNGDVLPGEYGTRREAILAVERRIPQGTRDRKFKTIMEILEAGCTAKVVGGFAYLRRDGSTSIIG